MASKVNAEDLEELQIFEDAIAKRAVDEDEKLKGEMKIADSLRFCGMKNIFMGFFSEHPNFNKFFYLNFLQVSLLLHLIFSKF